MSSCDWCNGSLTGYAAGIENKKYLLELEKSKEKV